MEENIERLKLEFLPRYLKMRIKQDIVVLTPASDTSPSRKFALKKGMEVTLMNQNPVSVATPDGAIHIGLAVRIDKNLPQEDDPTVVLQRTLFVPNEVLEVHPDRL